MKNSRYHKEWYIQALKPIIKKLNKKEQIKASEFVFMAFNFFGDLSRKEPEFYFGVIEKAHAKFAKQSRLFFKEFAEFMISLMLLYAKIACDQIDIFNEDALKFYTLKLFRLCPRLFMTGSIQKKINENEVKLMRELNYQFKINQLILIRILALTVKNLPKEVIAYKVNTLLAEFNLNANFTLIVDKHSNVRCIKFCFDSEKHRNTFKSFFIDLDERSYKESYSATKNQFKLLLSPSYFNRFSTAKLEQVFLAQQAYATKITKARVKSSCQPNLALQQRLLPGTFKASLSNLLFWKLIKSDELTLCTNALQNQLQVEQHVLRS